jgi:valine--pyruvate aminotransferase
MRLSKFGEKFTARTGILELMDDLGRAMAGQENICMLGGGNPAHIPEINQIWRRRMEEILSQDNEFERMLANYDTPQGRGIFLDALAELLNREYGWPVTAKNIAVTNGSQSAFFLLLNMFCGAHRDGRRRKILFPLTPEYIGYADQSLDPEDFVSFRSSIEEEGSHSFKYHVDFSSLQLSDDIAAMCVSRPTNPSGNLLTDAEIEQLAEIAGERGIPLLVDNAYGAPFPQIVFEDIQPIWNENIILSMSLSKLGLPAVRTGIILAREEIISAVSAVNAIMSLASGSIGQVLILPLIQSGEILRICRNIIKPFYLRKSRRAVEWIEQAFGNNVDYAIHKSEGSIFLWLWFKNLPISTKELYFHLKESGVLVVPGCYFFYGLTGSWKHRDECIRISYSQDDKEIQKGIQILADVVRSLD